MAKVFRGRFECKIDQKGRLSLPSAYRDIIPSSNGTLVVTNSQSQKRRCLDIYQLSDWEKLEKKIGKMPSLKREVQAYQRFYLSGGQVTPLDAQNRALVPASLRKYAGIEDEVVLVGMGRKIEVWPAKVWNEMQEQLADQFEEILESVADLEEGLGE